MNKAGSKKPANKGQKREIDAGLKGSRLAEWSRRKAAARSGAAISTGQDIVEHDAGSLKNDVSTTVEVKESDPALSDADMPPLESLDEHSDYSGFLSSGVSEKLRKRALRKLFHLDVYNLTDGLDDYAEDYTKFAALGDILTADLRLMRQREADALKEQLLSSEKSQEQDIEGQDIDTDSINELISQPNEDPNQDAESTDTGNEDQA